MNSNKEPDLLELIQHPSLSQFNDILHFTSTRNGGVSTGNYSSLNLGLYSDDNPENLRENFARILCKVGISECRVFLPFQTHGDIVRKIDESFLKQSKNIHQNLLNGVDAIVTNLPNQFIGVSTADCVPILLYDPVKKAIAAVHAGWRGTCKRIISNTVKLMEESYQTNPTDLIAVIGPSISPEVYEVSYELVDIFKKEKFETEKIFFQKREKQYLDLWTANKLLLCECGLNDENISISGHCTYTQQEKFFSARRLGIKSGRLMSGIMLKQ